MPEFVELALSGMLNGGLVFDQTLPLEQVADGCRAHGRAPRDINPAGSVNRAKDAPMLNMERPQPRPIAAVVGKIRPLRRQWGKFSAPYDAYRA